MREISQDMPCNAGVDAVGSYLPPPFQLKAYESELQFAPPKGLHGAICTFNVYIYSYSFYNYYALSTYYRYYSYYTYHADRQLQEENCKNKIIMHTNTHTAQRSVTKQSPRPPGKLPKLWHRQPLEISSASWGGDASARTSVPFVEQCVTSMLLYRHMPTRGNSGSRHAQLMT